MRVTCRFHCAACDSHFTSLDAFEAHREGDFAMERRCVPPDDCEKLAIESNYGVCRLMNGVPKRDHVVVYATARSVATRGAIRRAFRDAAQRPTEAA